MTFRSKQSLLYHSSRSCTGQLPAAKQLSTNAACHDFFFFFFFWGGSYRCSWQHTINIYLLQRVSWSSSSLYAYKQLSVTKGFHLTPFTVHVSYVNYLLPSGFLQKQFTPNNGQLLVAMWFLIIYSLLQTFTDCHTIKTFLHHAVQCML